MNDRQIDQLVQEFAAVVREYFAVHTKPIEERLAVLEDRPLPKYRGVWAAGESYPVGSFVTHNGSVWHCDLPTSSKPGTNPTAWTLAVKSGRDAR